MSGKIFLAAVVAWTAVVAQSADRLREKYGSPVSETFILPDGVGVTVKRGSDGTIAEMLIRPMRPDSLVQSRSMTLTYELAKRTLNELLPVPKRGKFLIGGFVDAICMPENDCAGSSEDYEKVSIFYNSAKQPGRVCYVDVRFKKRW